MVGLGENTINWTIIACQSLVIGIHKTSQWILKKKIITLILQVQRPGHRKVSEHLFQATKRYGWIQELNLSVYLQNMLSFHSLNLW